MATYKSTRTVNCSNPVILSFDVPQNNINLTISLISTVDNSKDISLNINTNVSNGSLAETVENVLSSQYETHENNTFAGIPVIIETEESKSGIIENGNVINKRPTITKRDENNFIYLDTTLDKLSNGSLIFFLTDNPQSDNVIHSQLGTFEQKDEDAYEITPFILCSENDNTPLLLDISDDSLTFLLLANRVERNYKKSPTTIYTKTSKNNISSKEYQSTNDILKAPYRARFIISNNGRMLSFSVYNKITNTWNTVKNFIFNIPKIEDDRYIMLETSNTFTNVTANF